MKKLLSVALVATVTLGSINLQAGDRAKKAWAYTKIAFGTCSLIGCVIIPLSGIRLASRAAALDQAAIRNKESVLNPKEKKEEQINFLTHKIEKVTISKEKVQKKGIKRLILNSEEKGLSSAMSLYHLTSPILYLPLGILLIKSGKSDLKKLKKSAQKQKAPEDKALLA